MCEGMAFFRALEVLSGDAIILSSPPCMHDLRSVIDSLFTFNAALSMARHFLFSSGRGKALQGCGFPNQSIAAHF